MGKKIKYPQEVQEHVDILLEYSLNDDLDEFNLFHLYPEELAFPNGYYDSRFFTLIGFNFDKKEKRIIEGRDGLRFVPNAGVDVDIIRIFADGSTLIRFLNLVKMSVFQAVDIKRA